MYFHKILKSLRAEYSTCDGASLVFGLEQRRFRAVLQRGEGKMESLKNMAVCTPEGGPLGTHNTGPRVKVTGSRGVQS